MKMTIRRPSHDNVKRHPPQRLQNAPPDAGSEPGMQRQHHKHHNIVRGENYLRRRNSSGSQLMMQRSSEFVRDVMPNRNSINHSNHNQNWSEDDMRPNQSYPSRRGSLDSGTTQVHSNTARRSEPGVSDTREYNNVNLAPPSDVIRHRSSAPLPPTEASKHRNSGNGGNASRIIAERKRRSTGDMPQSKGPKRRDPLAPPDHYANNNVIRPKRRATGGADPRQDKGVPLHRVNTAAGELRTVGDPNFEPHPAGSIMRKVSTGIDLHALPENHSFRQSKISDIFDSFTKGSVNDSLRRGGNGTASIRSNEHKFPSGIGGRRRTSRSSDASNRRQTRSGSRSSRNSFSDGNNPQSASDVDAGDLTMSENFQQQLNQLRVNHRRQQQQQQQQRSISHGRRRSSVSNSDSDFEESGLGMTVMSAPMGGRLSNYGQDMKNPNQEMGSYLREVAYEANKSEHSSYLGRDASRSSRYSSTHTTSHSTALGGSSHHSRAVSASSQHSKAQPTVVKKLPSVRTNDQRLFNDLLQGFNSGKRRRSSGDDLLIGFNPSRRRGRLKWYERHSLSKRTIVIAIVLVFLAIAMLGVVLLLSERGIGFGSGNDDDVTMDLANPTPEAGHYVVPPPSDIDGRCSPSNLPGSLPACLEACYPAACCYSNFEGGKKCLDPNDSKSFEACKRYRPYCDIFHDGWDGATDGILRTPRADLVSVCQQLSGKDTDDSSKLRARKLSSRNLLIGSAEVICEQYCEASKCCAFDVVVHPYSVGLELSASGVYTDASTKEHVVTNCQDDLVYQKNKDLCAEYDKFCTWGDDMATSEKKDAWTKRPTMDPASTMMPSVSPSILPSMLPSSSSRPTPFSPHPSHAPTINVFTIQWTTKKPLPAPSVTPSKSISPSQKFKPSSQPSLSTVPTISRANVALIEASCAGADNIALMANGIQSVRTKCLDACLNGLCCYTEQLGYSSFIDSCYYGNEAVCEEYESCLWLKESGQLTFDPVNDSTTYEIVTEPNIISNETSTFNSITNSSISSNETIIINANISAFNSSIAINETALTNDEKTSLGPSTVVNEIPLPIPNSSEAVDITSPEVDITEQVDLTATTAMVNSTTLANATELISEVVTLITLTVPPPPTDLDALCALGQGRFCTEICEDVACCFEEAPELNCTRDNTEICQGYAPCSIVFSK